MINFKENINGKYNNSTNIDIKEMKFSSGNIKFPDNVKNMPFTVNTSNKKAKKMMETKAVNDEPGVPINFNVKYNIDEISSGAFLLLRLNTTAGKKVVFHSISNANIDYETSIFYIENNTLNYVAHSVRCLLEHDVDAFIALGGVYYIAIDFTGGTGDFSFLVAELSNYSTLEPCENLYDALSLTPSGSISVSDFFDNYIDYDFYAFSNSVANQTVYLNFLYSGSNLINPLKYNPPVLLKTFLLANNTLTDINSEVIYPGCVDKAIVLESVGTYYFALVPTDNLPFGQMQEYYTFSVTTSMQNPTTLPSNQVCSIDLTTIEGSIDYGTYNVSEYSSISHFWVNGTAVHFNGIVNNWSGTSKQIRVRVTDNYDSEPKYGMAYINANGTFDAIIPLFKTTARENSFTYGGETMDWNWIEFVNNDGTLLPITFNRINSIWYNNLRVGVCYNDAPLNH